LGEYKQCSVQPETQHKSPAKVKECKTVAGERMDARKRQTRKMTKTHLPSNPQEVTELPATIVRLVKGQIK